MKIIDSPLAGVFVVESPLRVDHRGAFGRLYCDRELQGIVGDRRIVQINYSRTSRAGSVRGMHYQKPPHAEMKFIRCLKGRVWDVAVDLRAGSPTFLQWHAEELTQDDSKMIVIGEGFAHGFQSLEPDSELLYLHTAFYSPEAEGGISYADPRLNITWPLAVADVSQRDTSHPAIGPDFGGIVL